MCSPTDWYFFLHFLSTDLRNTHMIIFGLAAFLVQCSVNSPVTSLSHVCGWTVNGARAPYMCVPARVCTSLREPRYRYTKAELLSLSRPCVCSSDVFTRLADLNILSTDSSSYQRHRRRRKRPYRGGRRKRGRAIPVRVTQRNDYHLHPPDALPCWIMMPTSPPRRLPMDTVY